MNYTLHQLQIFLRVAQTGSITRAAEELHLTQPAVSIQLKNFQDQFDIPLTEVVGRQLFVTEFGNEIAHTAEQILQQVNTIKAKTMAYKGELAGRLKISVVSTGKYVMPYFLREFIQQHAGVELQMDVTNKSKVIESLEANSVDFALVSILPKQIAVEKMDLLQNKLFLVGQADKKWKTKQAYSKEMLNELPLIFREEGSGTRQTMEGFLDRSKIKPGAKMELTSNEAVKQAVLAGLGYSIMPLIGIKNELRNKELQIIPIKGLPIKTTWSLIWLKGKKHSPVADAFRKQMQDTKNEIVKNTFHWYEAY
jgi:DNA-binding transcriptional LysR family regulator